MNRFPLSAPLVLLACCLAGGCSVVTNMTTAKATFSVAVKNQSTQPIRIGLAKDGPPFEEEWSSPEEVAIANAKRPEIAWGQTILPGQTATIAEITGRFSDGVHGFVRVYAGDVQMADMLAVGRRSPNRLDIPLAEGSNRLIVLDDGGRLAFKRLPPEPAPATAKK